MARCRAFCTAHVLLLLASCVSTAEATDGLVLIQVAAGKVAPKDILDGSRSLLDLTSLATVPDVTGPLGLDGHSSKDEDFFEVAVAKKPTDSIMTQSDSVKVRRVYVFSPVFGWNLGDHLGLFGLVHRLAHRHSKGELSLATASACGDSTTTDDACTTVATSSYVGAWACWLVATLLMIGFATWQCGNRKEVDLPASIDESVIAARGRPCWVTCCGAASALLSLALFGLTLANIAAVNADIAEHPEAPDTLGGKETIVTRYPMENGGQRAFQAAIAVALSVMIGTCTLLVWRRDASVKVTVSCLAQFALRGGSLSLVLALIFEFLGAWVLGKGGVANVSVLDFGTMCSMLVVGFSEEGAKLFAVLCGTCIVPAASFNSEPSLPRGGCCSGMCRLLLEQPHALMLAGLAAGYGFMTVENAGYVMSAASSPVTSYDTESGPDAYAGATVSFFTMLTITVRVLLNIHPWLAGLSAARVASVVFKEPVDGTAPTPSPGVLLWAILPSSLIHALYDFLLTVAPAVVALLTPIVLWYVSRRLFLNVWTGTDAPARDAPLAGS